MYDVVSLPSCAPSDEWGNEAEGEQVEDAVVKQEEEESYGTEKSQSVQKEKKMSDEKSWFSKPDHKLYISNSSFAEYLSHIIPSRFTQACTTGTGTETHQETRAGDTRTDSRITERSSHSRCYIENTESIRDRRDDRREKRGVEGDDARDDSGNNDAVYSVEEYTQISEITMDIPTVIAESKFVACSGLPTIEEAKRFDPTIAACTADFSRKNIRAQCGGTGENSKSGNKDVIDFVFELVEDTFCVPLNRSRAEKKKAFMEAYHEESIKFARTNSLVDPWQTSSKHSRSNRTPRRSGKGPSIVPATNNKANQSKEARSSLQKEMEDAAFMIVDKPPPSRPHISPKMDEEQTLDWSKIMSFAEKQLEADGKSVISRATDFTSVRASISDRRSFFTTKDAPTVAASVAESTYSAPRKTPNDQDKSTTSSLSNSSSTHATAAESTNLINEAVQDMRDFSAMDSSSFEEEPRRLLLTSLLLRLLLQIVPGTKRSQTNQSSSKRSTEVSSMEFPNEGLFHMVVRYTVFFSCFVLWPAGIPRTKIEYKPILKKPEKPSLLKLVFEADEQS
jgi:hypothetical protein